MEISRAKKKFITKNCMRQMNFFLIVQTDSKLKCHFVMRGKNRLLLYKNKFKHKKSKQLETE